MSRRASFRILSLAAAVAALAPAAGAEPAASSLDELDRRLSESFQKDAIPGASVAIVEGGRVVFMKGYGVADTAARTPVTPDTPFRAGSISKSLTGIAVMRAVEDGKIALDAKVADLAPEVRFTNPWEATDPLRVVHLLEHTTGWPDISLDVLARDAPGWTLTQGVLYASKGYTSRWKPGLFSTYNNAGPSVAGYLLEKAVGQGFAPYTRDAVLRPMGMAQADFDLTPELKRTLAKSYGPAGSESPYQTILLPPSGSLVASARDLAQLVLFHLGRGTVDGRRILSPASVDRIERQETALAARAGLTSGYGLGNAPFPGDGFDFRGHNGGIDSYTSVFGYSVADGTGFVVLVNGGEGTDFNAPASNLIKAYLKRNRTATAPADAAATASADLDAHAGFYATVSPTYEFLRIYAETVLLPAQRVSVKDGRLHLRGALVPTGGALFRRENRSEPSIAFTDLDGEHLMVTGFNTLRRESMLQAAPKLLVLAVLAMALVVGVALLPVTLVSALRGRLAAPGAILVRVLPTLAIVALLATFVLPLSAFMSQAPDSIQGLAHPSPLSVGILAASLGFPILAALGLWRALASREAAGRFVRGWATVASSAVLVAAVYAAGYGWIGVRTWSW